MWVFDPPHGYSITSRVRELVIVIGVGFLIDSPLAFGFAMLKASLKIVAN
jgi:hypothetical protein